MTDLLISIISPSYNQGRFIEGNILSVLNQDYPNIEHIIMDGGSTDNTIEVLKKYNHSLIWKSEPDNGTSDAFNKGFLISKGGLIGWLNSDDTYQPNCLSKVVEYFDKHPDVSMIYGECNKIDEGDNIIAKSELEDFNLKRFIHTRNFIAGPSVLFRRQAFEEVGFMDPNLHFVMDYDLWIKIGKKFKIERVPFHIGNIRKHPAAKTHASANWKRVMKELISVSRRHGGHIFSSLYRGYLINTVKRYLFRKIFKSRRR
jgi:glycosyltransferase involved in cell wall biosynthesis